VIHPRVPRGVGAFAGRQEPQALDLAPAVELIDGLLGPGGLAVAMTTRQGRRFTGSDLTPQMFLAPPAYPNDKTGLETVSTAGVGNYRKALNRQRGRLAV
jgi:hypothetical protein